MTTLLNSGRVSSQHELQLTEFQPAMNGAPVMLGHPGISASVRAPSVGVWEAVSALNTHTSKNDVQRRGELRMVKWVYLSTRPSLGSIDVQTEAILAFVGQ